MPCTADTTTWVGTAIALYYMLCTTDTDTCMGTGIALYYICYALRIPPHAWTLPSLYTICYALLILPHAWVLPSLCITCYALRVLSHAWVLLSFCTVCYMQCAYCQHVYVLPLLYTFMPLWYIIVWCILSPAEQLQALPLVHIIIVCLYCYFIPVDRATTCTVLPSLYYMRQVLPN